MTPLSQLARETAEHCKAPVPNCVRCWGDCFDQPCRCDEAKAVEKHNESIEASILSALEKATAEAAEEPIDGDTDASIGRSWRENSSLEKWFPFTAKEIKDLRTQAEALATALETMIAVAPHSGEGVQRATACMEARATIAAYRKEKQP